MQQLLLPLRQVRAQVVAVHYGLGVARHYIVQDHVNQVVVSHFDTHIESIDIIPVVLDSTCLFDIIDLVKTSF